MSDSILVAVDGSSLSETALPHASTAFPGVEISAYHVVDLFAPDFGTHPTAPCSAVKPRRSSAGHGSR